MEKILLAFSMTHPSLSGCSLTSLSSSLKDLLLFTWLMREMPRMQSVDLIVLNLEERVGGSVLSGQSKNVAGRLRVPRPLLVLDLQKLYLSSILIHTIQEQGIWRGTLILMVKY